MRAFTEAAIDLEDTNDPSSTTTRLSLSKLEGEIRKLMQEFGISAVEASFQKVKNDFAPSPSASTGPNISGSVPTDDTDTQSVGSTSTTGSAAQYFNAAVDETSSNILRIQKAMLEASFDAQFAVNESGKIRHVNKAAVEKFGYANKGELVGKNINMIVGGGHAERHDSYLKSFKDTRIKHLIGSLREVSGRKKDGAEFPCIIGIEVIEITHSHGRDDELLYFACIRDITDQKQAQLLQEQHLQDSKIRSAILDASFDSMFAINLDGEVQMVNAAAIEIFGYASQEELVGKNISNIVGGGLAGGHDNYLRNYKETGKTSLIGSMREMPARRKDGTEFPVVIGIKRVDREDNDNPLMVAFIRDITLQHQTIQDQRIRSAILDAAFDPMVSINLDGSIQMVNEATIKVFGYDSAKDLVGKNVDCIVGGGFATGHDGFLKKYKETGKTNLIGSLRELPAKRKDGTEFPVIIGIKRVDREDSKNPLMVAFIRDITERKETERLQHQVIQDQKIRSAILDAAFDAMFAINTYGIIQMVNRAAVKQFGYKSTEELLGQNIKIIVGGGHAGKHDDYLKSYRETGITRIIGSMRELQGRRKNGEEFPIVLGIEQIENEDGDLTYDENKEELLVAFVRDITEQKRATELEIDVRSAEELLHNMLPEEIAGRLKADPHHLADSHEDASILFADIVGFTAMSSNMSPVDLVKVLNDLFTRFDHLVAVYGLNKVKTIGDCYMVTTIPSYQDPENAAAAMCHFALDMIDALHEFNDENPANKLDLRVGINTGSVVAGVVGTSRFLYDLWGDAVNLASRMESTGVPSRVQISRNVVDNVVEGEFEYEARGLIQCKGKGLVEAFMLDKRLRPKDKYLIGSLLDSPSTESLLNASLSNKRFSLGGGRGARRASTLQDTLLALQGAMTEFHLSSAQSSAMSSIDEQGTPLSSDDEDEHLVKNTART